MPEIKFIAVFGILFSVILILVFRKFLYWKRDVDKKNIRLMQLYLEIKFLYKNLADSANTSSSNDFCKTLILSIKEYYNLEEIMIVDSLKMNLEIKNISLFKKNIHVFLKEHEREIVQRIKNKNHLIQYAEVDNKKYLLHIFELFSNINSDSFIICVENYPTLLSKNELLGLENNVNLLRTRLIADD